LRDNFIDATLDKREQIRMKGLLQNMSLLVIYFIKDHLMVFFLGVFMMRRLE